MLRNTTTVYIFTFPSFSFISMQSSFIIGAGQTGFWHLKNTNFQYLLRYAVKSMHVGGEIFVTDPLVYEFSC